MSVLVTGAGVVGQEVARQLAGRGTPVILADLRAPEPSEGIVPLTLDITEGEALTAACADNGVSGVIHTAALLSTSLRADPLRGLEVNVMGTARVLEAARATGVRRVVLMSSTTVVYSAFGSLAPVPIPEDATLRMLSDRPRSLYAMTKIATEQLGLLWRDLYGLETVSLRLAAVLGGPDATVTSVPGRLFARLIAAAREGDTLELDDPFLVWAGQEEFVDFRDCAAAALAALDAPAPSQGVYTIAHPEGWTLQALADEVARLFGPFTLRLAVPCTTGFAGFPYPRPALSDLSAARDELGFVPRHALADTLSLWRDASPAREIPK